MRLYYDADDAEGRLGRWWWLLLPVGLFLALPVGIATMGFRPISTVAQALYAWTMSLGIMGLPQTIEA